MFSEALYIMDKNTERHMIRDLQEEVDLERQRADEEKQRADNAEKQAKDEKLRADSAEKRADSAEQSEEYARHQLDDANAIIAKYKAKFGEL